MKFLIILLIYMHIYALSPEEEIAQKAYLANINTILIFTSESGLSSGKYKFTKAKFEMESYSLPFKYHFKPFNENMNWFINGGVGYSITRLDPEATNKSSNTTGLNYDNKLQTYLLGLGGGLRYKIDYGIEYLASLGIIYSRVGTSVNPDDKIGDAIEDFFDGEYNNNITYKFLLASEYHTKYKEFKPYVKGLYKWYQTKADFTFDALTNFNTQSSLISLETGFETPTLFSYKGNSLSLEPYIKLNYLQGDVSDVVQFERYINIGALAYWNTPAKPSWIERFYFELSTIRAEGLEGYNVGVGFTIDY